MAEAESTEKPKSRKPLVVAVVVGLLAAGGGSAWFWLRGLAVPESAHGGEAQGAEGEAGHGVGAVKTPLAERLLSLDPFVVNLDGEDLRRFLKARIELETRSPAELVELQGRTAEIRDAVIVALSSKRVEDLGSFEGKVMLKSEILLRLSDLLGEDRVQSVLITEFVIQ